MSPRKTRDIRAALQAKGFERVDTHHEMYWLRVGSKKTSIRTRISQGQAEYTDGLLAQMAKQLKLKRQELDELVDCTMTGDGYIALLREKGDLRD